MMTFLNYNLSTFFSPSEIQGYLYMSWTVLILYIYFLCLFWEILDTEVVCSVAGKGRPFCDFVAFQMILSENVTRFLS